jgi:hypothetical protein
MAKNKRWITGEKILRRWDAQPFELLKAFENGLPAYFSDYMGVMRFDQKKHIPKFENFAPGDTFHIDPRIHIHQEWIVTKFLLNGFDNRVIFGDVVFNMAEVLEYEQKHGIGPAASGRNPDDRPPLLALAHECWSALFGKQFTPPDNRQTAGQIVTAWLTTHARLTAEECKALTTICTPDAWRRNKPEREHYGLTGENTPEHPFFASELADAEKVWRELVQERTANYTQRDLENHLRPIARECRRKHRRFEVVLSLWR